MERYWTWNYEIRDLGCFPGSDRNEYRGHNTPVEIVKYADAQATIAALQQQLAAAQNEIAVWRDKLNWMTKIERDSRAQLAAVTAALEHVSKELQIELKLSADLQAQLATVTAERDALEVRLAHAQEEF